MTGGSTLRNKAIRLTYEESCTPSPAKYNPNIQGKCKRLDPTPTEGKGKLYACRVPYSIHDCGPSIPTKFNENGYIINEYGDATRLPPDKHDTTLGPAFYNLNSDFRYNYTGCKWSERTSKRCADKIDRSPGPATYSPQFPKCTKHPEEEEFREMARLFTFLPRFTEAQQMRFLREGCPGPADYDIRHCSFCKISPGIKPKPFISKSKRFKRLISNNPAPDTYEIVEVPHTVSRKHIPFFVQSSRFSSKNESATPAPGEYELKSSVTEKLKSKKNKFLTIEPPFNKTSPRNTTPIKKDAAYTPSPAEYSLDAAKQHCKILPSSMFKSKVPRFSKLCKKNEISPAHYSINEPYNFTRNPVSHNAFEIAFDALSLRKDMTLNIRKGPGPADYIMKHGNLSTKGHYFPVGPRFASDCETPGPGTYYIHPSFRTSTYNAQKSHNLHIREHILRKKLRRHPNETWAKWAEQLTKKKKLRWFINEGKEFTHCGHPGQSY